MKSIKNSVLAEWPSERGFLSHALELYQPQCMFLHSRRKYIPVSEVLTSFGWTTTVLLSYLHTKAFLSTKMRASDNSLRLGHYVPQCLTRLRCTTDVWKSFARCGAFAFQDVLVTAMSHDSASCGTSYLTLSPYVLRWASGRIRFLEYVYLTCMS